MKRGVWGVFALALLGGIGIYPKPSTSQEHEPSFHLSADPTVAVMTIRFTDVYGGQETTWQFYGDGHVSMVRTAGVKRQTIASHDANLTFDELQSLMGLAIRHELHSYPRSSFERRARTIPTEDGGNYHVTLRYDRVGSGQRPVISRLNVSSPPRVLARFYPEDRRFQGLKELFDKANTLWAQATKKGRAK